MYLKSGARLIALASWENAVLRFAYAAAIILVAANDFEHINITQAVRSSGATTAAGESRGIFFETLGRSLVNILVFFTILFTIFTTPADEDETVLDQTMNFTALLILVDLDSIFSSLAMFSIDKLEIRFD